MEVSDIAKYITKIMWWGLKRILSSRFRDIQKSDKSQNLATNTIFSSLLTLRKINLGYLELFY